MINLILFPSSYFSAKQVDEALQYEYDTALAIRTLNSISGRCIMRYENYCDVHPVQKIQKNFYIHKGWCPNFHPTNIA